MAGKEMSFNQLKILTWEAIKAWAGARNFYMGLMLHQENGTSDIAITEDDALIAWVKDSSDEYVTKVYMINDGFPNSICTCSHKVDCRHGVTVILEYQKRIETLQKVPNINPDDVRLMFFLNEEPMEEAIDVEENCQIYQMELSDDDIRSVDGILRKKTKSELIDLIHKICSMYTDVASDIIRYHALFSGNIQSLIEGLRREIFEIDTSEGDINPIPQYSSPYNFAEVRTKLESLIRSGHADTVLVFGEELLSYGADLMLEGDLGIETAGKLYECMPAIVEALRESSLKPADKLIWAVNTILNDPYDMCDAFYDYLYEKHDPSTWSEMVDQILARLSATQDKKKEEPLSVQSIRDRLSHWAIHGMECSNRKDEIIPLCQHEIEYTQNYERLVHRLISEERFDEAEEWIHKGIKETIVDRPSIASQLREQIEIIYRRKENWSGISALRIEKFIETPDAQTFSKIRLFSEKAGLWIPVRKCLLEYLESGTMPQDQKEWPLLPDFNIKRDLPDHEVSYPLSHILIHIFMSENDPERILHWYERIDRNSPFFNCIDEDEIAEMIEFWSPLHSIEIWKNLISREILMSSSCDHLKVYALIKKMSNTLVTMDRSSELKEYISDLKKLNPKDIRLADTLSQWEKTLET